MMVPPARIKLNHGALALGAVLLHHSPPCSSHACSHAQPLNSPHPCCPCCGQADLEVINAMFTEEAADALLSGKPDFVLDAIDNIDTKVGAGAAVPGLQSLSTACEPVQCEQCTHQQHMAADARTTW
jgi:hypothetical protein